MGEVREFVVRGQGWPARELVACPWRISCCLTLAAVAPQRTTAAAAGAYSLEKKIEFQFKDLTAKWCMDKGFVTVFG